MVLSDRYKFIFIEIPKTGATSMEKVLSPYGALLGKNPEIRHRRAIDAKKMVGNVTWKNYFTFAFVRNPWDVIVSWYSFRRREELSETDHPKHKNYVGKISFDDFVKYRLDDILPQHSFIMNEEDEILVDYVGRFENIEADFQGVRKRIGLPDELELPHLLQTEHGPYQDYYNDKTRKIVFDRYRKDLELFDYKF